jgi:putative ABC transport system ATP-binding protein
MVAIMGPSGSGKTTMLNILGGMDTVTAGKYKFDDIVVSSLSVQQLHRFRKEKISFVFQNFQLMDKFSVYENVELPLLARKKHGYRKDILDMLDYVGISKLVNHRANKLSRGEQQRCSIARAAIADTPVILADEPTGALDVDNSEKIMTLFRDLNKKGKTIVVVTHDEKVAKKCDRLVRIEDGKRI